MARSDHEVRYGPRDIDYELQYDTRGSRYGSSLVEDLEVHYGPRKPYYTTALGDYISPVPTEDSTRSSVTSLYRHKYMILPHIMVRYYYKYQNYVLKLTVSYLRYVFIKICFILKKARTFCAMLYLIIFMFDIYCCGVRVADISLFVLSCCVFLR